MGPALQTSQSRGFNAAPPLLLSLVLVKVKHCLTSLLCFIAIRHTLSQLRLQQYTTPTVYVSSKLPFVCSRCPRVTPGAGKTARVVVSSNNSSSRGLWESSKQLLRSLSKRGSGAVAAAERPPTVDPSTPRFFVVLLFFFIVLFLVYCLTAHAKSASATAVHY